jgi:polyisoprenoid-binding protein YceI
MKLPSFVLAAALAFGTVLPAAAEPYVLDKSHAHIMFSADHLGFSTVHGQFRKFDAQIDFNPEKVEETRVRFVIDAASVDTFWDARDEHLRGADFFDVANHPEIVFESTEVRPTGGESALVIGNMTIKGVTQQVSFEAELNKMGPSPFDPTKTIAGFSAKGNIDRVAFGMDYAAPAVSAVIPVSIELEMSPAN